MTVSIDNTSGEQQTPARTTPPRWKKAWPFVLVVFVTVALLMGLMLLKKPPEKSAQPQPGYLVEARQLFPEKIQLTVESQGVLRPKRQISLVAEVSGKIKSVADSFAAGAIFSAGDVLITIDPADYQVAVQRAEAAVAQAEAQLELEQARSEVARRDWEKYGKKGRPSPLALNLPQVASAKAALQAALADLEKARRDLEKTRIRAPFDGIVLQKNADIGQFVTPGANLGGIANTDVAEVRLSLTDEDLSMLDLSRLLNHAGPPVRFALEWPLSEAVIADTWHGTARRVEAQREQTTLLNYLVVEIDDPFSLLADNPAAPLKLNTFLQAKIPSKTLYRVFRIERDLLLRGDRLNIYKPDNTLEIRPVRVLYRDKQFAYVDQGLKPGEYAVLTPIVSPYDGMPLRQAGTAAPDTGKNRSSSAEQTSAVSRNRAVNQVKVTS